MNRNRTGFLWTISMGALLILSACSGDSTAPDNAPEGHTSVRGGVAHAPGLNTPLQNCTQCHGVDLTGGNDGEPSCFTCHGEKW
jgi:hypothetical protein